MIRMCLVFFVTKTYSSLNGNCQIRFQGVEEEWYTFRLTDCLSKHILSRVETDQSISWSFMEIYHEKNTCGNFDQSVCENHHFKSQEIEPTQTTTYFQQESFKQKCKQINMQYSISPRHMFCRGTDTWSQTDSTVFALVTAMKYVTGVTVGSHCTVVTPMLHTVHWRAIWYV